ncbi:hypothetical protein CWO33_10565 [Vibrio splendidus]|uniref:hypothetical protein n=1 Tax=Vibrio splendidus TaxID=29497 RepID=UPI000D3894C1|nr:hypothetical protein [Vibrio splendidus]PTQ15352.1 hypothetical protein CWO33_10565 [Vibrio splendidus]
MENLSAEYFKLIEIINQYDNYLMTIKGWSITVGIAIIGYAFQQTKKSILLLCIVSSLSFYVMDAKFKEYQVSYYPRMRAIENCVESIPRISNTTLHASTPCDLFKIDRSWTQAKTKSSFVDSFINLGVAFPHFILIILAVLLYLKPKWLENKAS